MLSIASPAASPARRACGRQAALVPPRHGYRRPHWGLPFQGCRRALTRAGAAWQAEAGAGGRGDRCLRWTAGEGDSSRHRNRGAIDVAQVCVGTTQPGRVRIVPAQSGIRRSFSPIRYRMEWQRSATQNDARPLVDRHRPPAPPEGAATGVRHSAGMGPHQLLSYAAAANALLCNVREHLPIVNMWAADDGAITFRARVPSEPFCPCASLLAEPLEIRPFAGTHHIVLCVRSVPGFEASPVHQPTE